MHVCRFRGFSEVANSVQVKVCMVWIVGGTFWLYTRVIFCSTIYLRKEINFNLKIRRQLASSKKRSARVNTYTLHSKREFTASFNFKCGSFPVWMILFSIFFLLNCKFSFYFVNVNYVRHTRAKPCVDDIPNNASASAASTGCCHSTFALGKCIKLCFLSLKFRRHQPLWIVLCCMFLSGQVCHSRNWNWRKQIW